MFLHQTPQSQVNLRRRDERLRVRLNQQRRRRRRRKREARAGAEEALRPAPILEGAAEDAGPSGLEAAAAAACPSPVLAAASAADGAATATGLVIAAAHRSAEPRAEEVCPSVVQ